VIRIATRSSALALAQAGQVATALATHGVESRLVEVATTGDLDRISPVATLTEVGAFVRAVQRAVLDGKADVAVHSCKDLPVDGPDELVAFYPPREAPWDVLCGPALADLTPGARVGTGSPRRSAQLLELRPDLTVCDIRGNVDTRLAKLAAGDYEAVILAEAGLRRLGRADAIGHRFTLAEMVPAPAQGALALEAIRNSAAAGLLAVIDHPTTRAAVTAERLVLGMTGAGCRAALAVHVEPLATRLEATGFVSDRRGPRTASVAGADATTCAARLVTALGLGR
jgi:hydroxymethylbilane synthase